MGTRIDEWRQSTFSTAQSALGCMLMSAVIIIACPFMVVGSLIYLIHKTMKHIGTAISRRLRHKIRERRAREWRNNPPEVRKNRASLALVKNDNDLLQLGAGKVKINQQTGCIFLGLPQDIKRLVYEECLGVGDQIFVNWEHFGNKRKTFLVLRDPSEGDQGKPLDVLNILTVCRQIYIEFLPILYGAYDVAFPTPISFLALTASIPEAHFHLIRRVRLDLGKSFAIAKCSVNVAKKGDVVRTIPLGAESGLHQKLVYLPFKGIDGQELRPWWNSVPFEADQAPIRENEQIEVQHTVWERVCYTLNKIESLIRFEVHLGFDQMLNLDRILKPLEGIRVDKMNLLLVETASTERKQEGELMRRVRKVHRWRRELLNMQILAEWKYETEYEDLGPDIDEEKEWSRIACL